MPTRPGTQVPSLVSSAERVDRSGLGDRAELALAADLLDLHLEDVLALGVGALELHVADVAGAVKAAKGGAVEFRVEKAGIIHAGVGKASFTEDALVENIKAFADAVQKAKPAGAKGTYVKRVSLSSTMGPGFHIDPTSVQ